MLTGIENGYASPFVRLYYKDKELSANVENFSYLYDEEGDDVCKMSIILEDRTAADEPQWQEKSELKILWGYIGGEISPSRKIYIQQLTWTFSKENIRVDIEATDKAVSLKYQDSQEIHRDISLPGLASKIGAKNDIEAFLEIPDDDDEKPLEFLAPGAGGTESWDLYLKRNRKAIDKRDYNKLAKDAKAHPEKYEAAVKKSLKGYADQQKVESQKSDLQKYIDKRFKLMSNIPQANKTDLQVLKEYGNTEKNGPWLIDTRDDSITIRKRNFKQIPYKAYEYGGPEGTLIDFVPMSKLRSHKPSSMNVGFSSWDPASKTNYSGNASGLDDSNPTLVKFRKMYKFYLEGEKHGHGGDIIGSMKVKNDLIHITNSNIKARIDNAGDYARLNKLVPYTVSDKVKALKAAAESVLYQARLANHNYDPISNNPIDAYNNASNKRRSSELGANPATATIFGDPHLIVGKLITILGISKKYSGNYYIMKATHSINQNGYLTNMELCTQGTNIKTSDEDIKVKGQINKIIGPAQGKPNTKKIPVKTNPK